MSVLRYELDDLFWQVEYPFGSSQKKFRVTSGRIGESGLVKTCLFPTVAKAKRAVASAKTSVARHGYSLAGGDVPLVECPVCHIKARLLTPGHVRKHGLSWAELVELYPDVDSVPADIRMARSVVAHKVVRDNQHILQTPENIKKRTDAMHASLKKSGYYEGQRDKFIAMNKSDVRKPLIAKWNRERVWTDEARQKIAVKAAKRCGRMRREMSRPHLDLMTCMRSSVWFENLKPEYRVSNMSIDIALPEFKIAVEMQGCFWHGCSRCYPEPSEFQERKISADIARKKSLESKVWTVLLVSECRFRRSPAKVIASLERHAVRVCVRMESYADSVTRGVLPMIDNTEA